MNTHPEQWAAMLQAPGEQLGVRVPCSGHLSRGIVYVTIVVVISAASEIGHTIDITWEFTLEIH